jgi:cysteine desulfurase
MLYLDHSATTPPYDEVVDTVAQVMKRHFGNPSSLHHLGVEADKLVSRAREVVAGSLNVRPEEIVFTSGGTESNNLAIKGIAYQYRRRGRHLITSQVEHASVYECFRQLESRGFRVTYLPVDSTGAVDPEAVRKALTDETIAVSIMHVNNEVGRIQPVGEIGSLLKEYPRVLFHVDAVQSIGKLELNPAEAGVDLFSVSAHKIRGPKGVGFLYRRSGVQLDPLLPGGGQENGLRSGTENVPLIVGAAKALRMTMDSRARSVGHLRKLRERLLREMDAIPGIVVNGSSRPEDMAPHIVNFSVPGVKPEVVVHALEKEQIYISTRSACSSGEEKPSRVLQAMGLPDRVAASGLRVSFSADNTMEEMIFFAAKLKQVLRELVSSFGEGAAFES